MTHSINYLETNIVDSHDYLYRIMPEHYEDMKTEGIPEAVNLDAEQVMHLEALGMLVSMKAVMNNETAGLITAYVGPHMHNKDVIFATTNLINVDKKLGMKRVAIVKGLISNMEKLLKDKYKVQYFQVAISAKRDISKLVSKLGYNFTDYVLTKRI